MLQKLFTITTIFISIVQVFSSSYDWRVCNKNHINPPECKKFQKPPLVILSLDGFRREYLRKDIVKTLKYLAECGATTEYVYPSYPSKTFPNHYTMVTGLFPESHGIVDNEVFDKEAKKFVDIKSPNGTTKYYGGEPIWSMFKRSFPSKSVSSFFWAGSQMNIHPEHPIDFIKPYNKRYPFKDLLKDIQDQLFNETHVPELILAYHNQPDQAAHINIKHEHKIKQKLLELETDFEIFIDQLYKRKVLDCINLVVVSDHGMEQIRQNYEISKHVPSDHLENVFVVNNIIGTLHNVGENHVTMIYEELACKLPNVSVYTKETMPIRKHYAGHESIGDVMLEGAPGITFGRTPYDRQGDHGYDYLHESMFAIFVGKGPSFKQGVTIEPFQNIQLMNLWIDLLDIPMEEKLKNNGTVGFFDPILVNPRKILENATSRIQECKVAEDTPDPKKCPNSSPEEPSLKCKKTGARLPFLSSNENHCYESYCQDNLIRHKKCSACIAISETLKRDKLGPNNIENMKFYDKNYLMNSNDANKCDNMRGHISISVRKTLLDSYINVVDGQEFYQKVLRPLNALTNRYLRYMKVLHVLSGTAVDKNRDGVADDAHESSVATHIYRIIIFCLNGWRSISPPRCRRTKEMKTITFIFPIAKAKAWNCLTSDQLLIEYTATIADVERISGFKFHLEDVSKQFVSGIRQRITRTLWTIENKNKNLSGMPNFVAVIIFVVCLVL